MLNDVREAAARWTAEVLELEDAASVFHALPGGMPEAAALEIAGVALPEKGGLLPEAVIDIHLRRTTAAGLNRAVSSLLAALPAYDRDAIISLLPQSVTYRRSKCGGLELFEAQLTAKAAFAPGDAA